MAVKGPRPPTASMWRAWSSRQMFRCVHFLYFSATVWARSPGDGPPAAALLTRRGNIRTHSHADKYGASHFSPEFTPPTASQRRRFFVYPEESRFHSVSHITFWLESPSEAGAAFERWRRAVPNLGCETSAAPIANMLRLDLARCSVDTTLFHKIADWGALEPDILFMTTGYRAEITALFSNEHLFTNQSIAPRDDLLRVGVTGEGTVVVVADTGLFDTHCRYSDGLENKGPPRTSILIGSSSCSDLNTEQTRGTPSGIAAAYYRYRCESSWCAGYVTDFKSNHRDHGTHCAGTVHQTAPGAPQCSTFFPFTFFV